MKQNLHVFIYYGVILNESEAYDLAVNFGEVSIYDLVYTRDLSYQQIGQTIYSNKIVLGKEIFWDMSEYVIHFDVDNMIFKTDNVENSVGNLNINEEEIDKKLSELGINQKPQYYIISSFDSI